VNKFAKFVKDKHKMQKAIAAQKQWLVVNVPKVNPLK
jgi:hypothetical protein